MSSLTLNGPGGRVQGPPAWSADDLAGERAQRRGGRTSNSLATSNLPTGGRCGDIQTHRCLFYSAVDTGGKRCWEVCGWELHVGHRPIMLLESWLYGGCLFLLKGCDARSSCRGVGGLSDVCMEGT